MNENVMQLLGMVQGLGQSGMGDIAQLAAISQRQQEMNRIDPMEMIRLYLQSQDAQEQQAYRNAQLGLAQDEFGLSRQRQEFEQERHNDMMMRYAQQQASLDEYRRQQAMKDAVTMQLLQARAQGQAQENMLQMNPFMMLGGMEQPQAQEDPLMSPELQQFFNQALQGRTINQ